MISLRKFFISSVIFGTISLFAAQVEVLHWWTSGSEAKSVSSLKKMLEKEGHEWKDFSVAGGNGSNAMTVLKSRVVSGNPPTAAQIKGPSIQEWAKLGVLANLDEVAKKEKWDEKLPKVFSQQMKYKGHYVAVPVNVHRNNWMWVNPKIFKKAGAKIPTTWEEFETAALKIKKAGFIPVAQGGQPWQETTLFEIIALGVGGADFYRQAFVDLNPDALGSKLMKKTFDILKMVKSFTDKNASGRDWNLATSMVYKGQAAMQFMGDWAKGEFKVAGKKFLTDYTAVPAPGTKGSYMYNIDSFAMFKQKDSKKTIAQDKLAQLILSDKFQILFNQAKGSVPVKLGIKESNFDKIGQESMEAIISSAKNNTLVPSMAHQMAVNDTIKGVFFDVVTNFYNSNESSSDAVKKLVSSIKDEL